MIDSNTIHHHIANLAAVAVPTMSFSLNGPQLLTYATGILGLVWYAILIIEKISLYLKRHRHKEMK